jgi:hypothetical protein
MPPPEGAVLAKIVHKLVAEIYALAYTAKRIISHELVHLKLDGDILSQEK